VKNNFLSFLPSFFYEMAINKSRLKSVLIRHEGLKLKPYKDTVGKLTIGVGRNLEDRGISKEEALFMLENDIKIVEEELDRTIPWWRKLDSVRQEVLVNMAFNLGVPKLLRFKKFLKALQEGNYGQASFEMLNSLWAKQVGRRAKELAYAMEKGEYPFEVAEEEDKLLEYLNEIVWDEVNNGW